MSNIRLRPFDEAELPLVIEGRARSVAEGVAAVAPNAMNPDCLRERIAAGGKLAGGRLDLAIEMDGRVIGEVDARSPEGGYPPGVFEIGIGIYDPAERGRGAGRKAVERLTSLLFARHKAHRVQASTDVDNKAMRRVLESLGYRFEGVMRGFMPAGDGAVDYALYAVIKPEWGAGNSSREG